ncbi:putative transcriptional regulator [Desulfitobacterium dehalogenans ATCC 51507]|uniref:Putative transcriptional regulator n=1 Tax=Desulfitobacterium dehalogenans (strain ATCC 51507 / DSM 9161 / JW/IU-DC1) TaxID=756499 RepID=I4A796_DESDJ|nr:metalloregulator ArsR/SmtB family transcription factor [Desulfitobacterium dehalogenans]AFL99830.1 putative transcriptional regulator [Desulfitobacterium dehalogenans ATCC 51507]
MDHGYAKYNEVAELLKVLAHPVRLCIVSKLLEMGESNVTSMHTCLNTPQSTISQHLQKLRSAGIVEYRRSGLEIYYKIKNQRITQLVSDVLQEV